MSIEQNTDHAALKWWNEPGVEAPQVSCYNPYTREFTGGGLADPSPLEPGVWHIPGLSVIGVAPEAPPGHVMVLGANGRTWNETEDHRGKTVYSVDAQETLVWGALGAIPDTHTLQAPSGQYEKWDGQQWVHDEVALAEALAANATRKQRLLNQLALEKIHRLNLAVRLNIATEGEKQALHDWEVFLVLLGRLDPSQALPGDSDWPEVPTGEAADAWLISMGFEEIEQPAVAIKAQSETDGQVQEDDAPGDAQEGASSTKSTNSTAK